MHILVINHGSVTLKWKLFEVAEGRQTMLAGGTIPLEPTPRMPEDRGRDAVRQILASLPARPDVIAHRVVHGGEITADVMPVDAAALQTLHELAYLAPLHNGPALDGIEATRGLGIPLVAAFDSAFHRTLPDVARRYALPAMPGVRRYGFHGWSHRSVMERYTELTGSSAPTIISLHLGGGCSAAAIQRGRVVDTSMGYSPLEGLVMGTRAGDVDLGVVLHLLRQGATLEQLERLFNRESGLQALAGTGDMRALLPRTDPAARFAVELFCYRIRKYVGAYLGVLEGAEAMVFTGGIGEHAAEIRRRVCERLTWAGLTLDETRNRNGEARISANGSALAAYVIPTDEERLIARETARLFGIEVAR